MFTAMRRHRIPDSAAGNAAIAANPRKPYRKSCGIRGNARPPAALGNKA
ncbi:hypothetical protein FRUB_00162 [Fimbriiglobus ruber]|uniref:Uncharacterized protein n=1 Tax=Fimbriiglobus ruber TaxID=1908690 RepID=A0A225DZR5_9BACT|nr:hypothetical protein FRUB_00162 [Fimbriiglobus ruber]